MEKLTLRVKLEKDNYVKLDVLLIDRKKQTGFTVVELLIVTVIIAILAVVIIVAYNGIQQRAEVATLTADLKQANTQLSTYAVDNGDLYPEDEGALSLLNGGTGITRLHSS